MNDQAFSRKHNPPADPRFVIAIERGFMMQEMEFSESLQLMRHMKILHDEAVANGNPNPRFVASNGEELHYVDPDYMEDAQEHLREYQSRVLGDLREAKTCSEQRDTLLKYIQDSFYSHVFAARPALTAQLMETAFDLGHEIYRRNNMPLTDAKKQASADGVLVPINRVATNFWQDAMKDITTYAEIVSDAGDDLRALAEAYVQKYAIEDQSPGSLSSPGALAALRYGRVVGIDGTAPTFSIDHPLKFSEIMETVLKDDLFGPYMESFNGNTTPELAWFIGRAMDAQFNAQESAPKQRTTLLKVHDAMTPEGRIPKYYERMKIKGAPVRYADTIVMMQDEKAQATACTLMNDNFSTHPSVATSIVGLVDAARDFAKTHKLHIGNDESPPLP